LAPGGDGTAGGDSGNRAALAGSSPPVLAPDTSGGDFGSWAALAGPLSSGVAELVKQRDDARLQTAALKGELGALKRGVGAREESFGALKENLEAARGGVRLLETELAAAGRRAEERMRAAGEKVPYTYI